MENNASLMPRLHVRTPVRIDVGIVGVITSFDAQIVDLSEGGAMVVGGSLPAKSRCEVHFGGQIVYATVMWSEADRMGLRFPFELSDGPLHQRLVITRSHYAPRVMAGGLRGPGGFGRRRL
jgi:hypothetical protein